MDKFDELYESKLSQLNEGYGEIIKLLKTLKADDMIEIIPERGKSRKMMVVRPYDPKYKSIEISSGKKRSFKQTKNGSVMDYGNGKIAWQPTMLTPVEFVKDIKLIGSQGLKLA